MPFDPRSRSVKTDKCLESYSLRIPEITKHELDKLTQAQKTAMIDEILIVMARHIHFSKFNPAVYLCTDINE